MRLLRDTPILLWAVFSSRRLSSETRELLSDPTNQLSFGAVSIWEVAIKCRLGRTDFTIDPRLFDRGLLENGYLEIPITSRHGAGVASLPPIHRDPFDRILVAQSIEEAVILLTADPVLAQYPGPIRLV